MDSEDEATLVEIADPSVFCGQCHAARMPLVMRSLRSVKSHRNRIAFMATHYI